MKIDQIRMERLHSLGNFNNVKIGISLTVEEGEDPNEAAAKVRTFLKAHMRLLIDSVDEGWKKPPEPYPEPEPEDEDEDDRA